MEGDPLQLLRVLCQRSLLVELPEKARVGEASGEDLAVAVHHHRRIVRIDIRCADEGVGERVPLPLAGGVRGGRGLVVRLRPTPGLSPRIKSGAGQVREGSFAHEILLVHPRGELDDFGGHVEIGFVEPAEQRHGPLGKPGILDHQPLILDQRQAGLGSNLRRAIADDRGAFFVIDDDMGCAQFGGVIARIGDSDVARMVEAVAQRHRAARDAVHLALDHVIAQQRDDA